LTLTARYPDASASEQEQYRRTLREKMAKLEIWEHHSPENYRNRRALVAAEIARVEGRELDAMRLYEQAVRSAHESGFPHNEAIASEAAGRFYLAIDLETNGLAHLRNARACYARWGADGKVRQLESQYPQLTEAEVHAGSDAMAAAIQGLDVTTVVKASQAVSSEIELAKLIRRLMTVALENAGADRGLLILPCNDDYEIAAVAEVRGGEIVLRHEAGEGSVAPDSIVRYAIRTHKSVILDDAGKAGPFSADDYIVRQRPRSIFCLPLVRQTAVAGVLYLENTLASHVFTPDRTALLSLLASQLAISLENTRLYSDLQAREAKIRRLVDANVIGIVITDVEGQMVEANDAFLEMIGYDRAALVSGNLRWTELTPTEWHDLTLRAITELRRTGSFLPYEKEFLRKDGGRVPVLVGGTAFGGPREQAVAFVVDLTERKRAEDALRGLEADLAHMNRLSIMGELAASLAHEITQPIATARNNAQAALNFLGRQPPDLHEVKEALDCVVGDADRAGAILDRIRDHIKKAPARKHEFDLNEAINEVVDLARTVIAKNEVAVQTRLAERLATVQGDRVQLQQVVLNLILNAVEALGDIETGRRNLLISTEQSGADDVLVAVRDSGPGVDAAQLERVFEAFYTTKPSGVGMGLSICRSIIAAHGGRLWAELNEPCGAVFQFTLPNVARGLSSSEKEVRRPAGRHQGNGADPARQLVCEDSR
jgi:PAS domain S-box-containing protein